MKRILFCLALFLTLLNVHSEDKKMKTESIVLGAGCFWCTEALYQSTPGILTAESGYANGKIESPTYEQVCSGTTGHAEVIKVTFDPAKITLARVLELFWQTHDPTTLNRQGNDVGTQYRSLIAYSDEAQKKIAEESKLKAAPLFKQPIVTEVAALTKFYLAEDYHQDYYRLNPNQPYCRAVIKPKLDKFKP